MNIIIVTAEVQLDILVNNAGVFSTSRKLTEEGYELMFGTNHLGKYWILTYDLEKYVLLHVYNIVALCMIGTRLSPVNTQIVLCTGHFLLTNLLLDKLKASTPSRVVILASMGHEHCPIKFDDLQSERDFSSLAVYGRSKSANVLFGVQLAKELEGEFTIYVLMTLV